MAAFVTQEVIEVLDAKVSIGYVTQEVVEVLANWSTIAVVTQLVVEVIHSHLPGPVLEVGIIIKGT